MEGFAQMDLWPGYAFTPDGKSLVFSNHGKLVAAGRRHAERSTTSRSRRAVEQFAAPRVTWQEKMEMGPVKAKILRWPSQSPDGTLDRLRGLRARLAAGDLAAARPSARRAA